jgi:hypothetical protein
MAVTQMADRHAVPTALSGWMKGAPRLTWPLVTKGEVAKDTRRRYTATPVMIVS